MSILNLIPSGVLKAGVLASARHIATAMSGIIVTYILAHHGTQADATTIAEGASAVILGLASYGFSLWDVKNVDGKIQAASTKVEVDVNKDVHYSEFNDVPKIPAVPPLEGH